MKQPHLGRIEAQPAPKPHYKVLCSCVCGLLKDNNGNPLFHRVSDGEIEIREKK